MAKKATKKTAARRKVARTQARRSVVRVVHANAKIGTRVLPTFENLDAVQIVSNGTIGVVIGVLSHFKGDPDYNVRFRDGDGATRTRYFMPGELAHA